MNEFLNFIRDEQIRSNVMTSARIQPICERTISIKDVMMGLKYSLEKLHKDL